ncbi:MAG: NUDIX hydrolase [Candidatus Woesearchaeota archaeon]
MAHLKARVAEYAIIINGKKFLMIQWGKEFDFGWHFPGGRIDVGEQEVECVVREVREEVGVEIEDLRPVYTKFLPAKYEQHMRSPRYTVFYLAKLKAGSEVTLKEKDFIGHKWFSKDDIANIHFWLPFYKDMLEKVLP